VDASLKTGRSCGIVATNWRISWTHRPRPVDSEGLSQRIGGLGRHITEDRRVSWVYRRGPVGLTDRSLTDRQISSARRERTSGLSGMFSGIGRADRPLV